VFLDQRWIAGDELEVALIVGVDGLNDGPEVEKSDDYFEASHHVGDETDTSFFDFSVKSAHKADGM
jgi:hypothetical protein